MVFCSISSVSVNVSPYANSPTRACNTCYTHNFHDFPTVIDGKCPIGRIEQAAEDAIHRVRNTSVAYIDLTKEA